MKKYIRWLVNIPFAVAFFPLFIVLTKCVRRNSENKPRLLFGPTPLINNKYWALALRGAGYKATTLMYEVYAIYKKKDFDRYYADFYFSGINHLDRLLAPYLVFIHLLLNYDIVHFHYDGGFLAKTPLRWLEPYLYKLAKIKIVVLPYGSDFHKYSQIMDLKFRHAMLINYPLAGRHELKVSKQIEFFNRHADCVYVGMMVEGAGRWDLLSVSNLTIDESLWKQKIHYSKCDGKNGLVRVMHTPNHRGVKGTEFIEKAVKDLIEEGYQLELVLLRNVPNDQVKLLMQEIDILAEQIMSPGHGLNALEGMASGLPVLSNTTNQEFRELFSTYSYLNQCPIVPTNTGLIKENLRMLVTDPSKRKALGEQGRQYVEKFHSNLSAQLIFGRIYEKIWHNKDVDLINYFHPLIGQYDSDYAAARAKQQELQGSC